MFLNLRFSGGVGGTYFSRVFAWLGFDFCTHAEFRFTKAPKVTKKSTKGINFGRIIKIYFPCSKISLCIGKD